MQVFRAPLADVRTGITVTAHDFVAGADCALDHLPVLDVDHVEVTLEASLPLQTSDVALSVPVLSDTVGGNFVANLRKSIVPVRLFTCL